MLIFFTSIQVFNVRATFTPFVQVLAGLEEKRESVKVGPQGSATSVNGGSFVGYELRNVPSGPDPLHHNRASPEKPRTP